MKAKTLIATLVIGSCWMASPVFAEDSPEAAIKAAKEAQKKAGSVGGEWRDTGKFIKKAEAAAKAGDTKKALKLAKKAMIEGENGYKQAMAEVENAKDFPAYMK